MNFPVFIMRYLTFFFERVKKILTRSLYCKKLFISKGTSLQNFKARSACAC